MQKYIELLNLASEKSNAPEFVYKVVISIAKESAKGENVIYIGAIHRYTFNDCKKTDCVEAFKVDIAKNNLGVLLYVEGFTIKHTCQALISLWKDGIKTA